MRDLPPHLRLKFNPFEPAGAGAPPGTTPLIPGPLKSRVQEMLDRLGAGEGIKVVVIVGGYGVGKTCLLEWLRDEALPRRRIMPFYFDNPGVHFYSLANRLLNTLGRKDFAKFIWELARPYLAPTGEIPPHLSYEDYLDMQSIPRNDEHRVGPDLRKAIMQAGVTDHEEISHCLARFVTTTKWNPYYDYRDFLPRNGGRRVPDGDHAPYFSAILRTLAEGTGTDAIAFLIDEFEELGLQRRLTRRTILDYRSTLTKLINLTHRDHPDLWLFLSMTPETYATTVDLEPAIAERFFGRTKIDIAPLRQDDAVAIVKSRVEKARRTSADGPQSPFPFRDVLPFRPDVYSNPRRLVKTCSLAISGADRNTPVPFRDSYLSQIERRLYPTDVENGSQR